MESSGFSSPRPDCFPAGLRVLVVDDDPTWLKILEKMLKKCNYEVTTCNLAREALDLLRGRKDGYDIVISDVNMPDMDGFKLLEHVGLEMDLPVIMMSVDGETSRVMKGVQHGACDYLLKPIRMKELRNIWQHVFRKKIHEVRDIEGHESLEELQMMRSAAELSDDGYFFGGDQVLGKKRKDVDSKNDDRVCGESSSSKKARVVWTVDLHQKFVKAVNLIGFEKVGPKKILDLMGVPWLTRENVASHLQKYRLYLSRLQKENELKATVGGTKHSELPLKDFASNACSKIPVPHDDKANLSMTESKAALPRETNDHSKSSASSISFDHSFGPLNSDAVSKPKIQVQYSWGGAAPPVGFKHEQIPHGRVRPLQFKKDQKPAFSAEQQFDHLPLPIHHIQIPSVETGLNSGTESKTTTSQHGETVTKVESTAALFSVHHESHHTIDPIPKGQSLEVQNLFTDPDSWNRDALLETGSSLRLWEEGFTEYSPQTEVYPLNPYLGAVDPFGFSNPDVPLHLYDSLKFNPEFSVDPMEYPVIDQGLYIA